MTESILAAVLLAAVGTWYAVRAGHHRHIVAYVRSLRPTIDVPAAFAAPPDDSPLVAPDLHLPVIRGRYGMLALLDAAPVERDTVAALDADRAEFAALVDSLRDPVWESRLALCGSPPPQWDSELKALRSTADAALRRLAERHASARQRLSQVGWVQP